MLSKENASYAESMFEKHPEIFPEQFRPLILRGQIELGMTPFEAKLAGGAFFYKVDADQAVWPEHPDPFKVMWAQSLAPDNSEIWMTFSNATQFPGEPEGAFRVHFQHGKAVDITKVEPA